MEADEEKEDHSANAAEEERGWGREDEERRRGGVGGGEEEEEEERRRMMSPRSKTTDSAYESVTRHSSQKSTKPAAQKHGQCDKTWGLIWKVGYHLFMLFIHYYRWKPSTWVHSQATRCSIQRHRGWDIGYWSILNFSLFCISIY